ncbi:MAG: hypothetical protein ABR920_10190 [Terriglobales bacterium]|jgi:hypothetical protein
MSVVEDMRKVLQDFLAPELRAVHARFEAVDVRLDAIEEKMEARFDSVNIRFAAIEDIATARHNETMAKIDGLKSSLELDKRVERLESRQPHHPS